ncbi:hypothetical protein HHX47_DHR5000162 [Lentinula edodes]|nr:hypothetical protein HHX47_DHR5000162 [Lentinula edodes]
MSPYNPGVILYRQVANVLPRPEITELLGLTYRRIPILTIGNDIYCDTSLIAAAIERRFPTSQGFGTIFPPKKHGGSPDTGLLKAFTQHYADTVLFNLGPILLPWDRFPNFFLKDRQTIAPNLNVQAMMNSQGKAMNALSAHLALVNEQLQDGREWLFDTELPSLADIGIHFTYNWWLDRLNKFIKTTRNDFPTPITLTGPEAADSIAKSSYEPYNVIGFDAFEAARLNLVKNQIVNVVPDDTGPQYATSGKLVAFNHEEIVIETKGTMNAIFRCHFPRIGFTPKGVQNHRL